MGRILIIPIIGLLIGCAPASSSDSPAAQSGDYSSLFKTWSDPISGLIIPLSGGHFGNFDGGIGNAGVNCICNIQVNGWPDVGFLEIRLCKELGIFDNPSCAALHKRYEYEIISGKMNLCTMTVWNFEDRCDGFKADGSADSRARTVFQ